MKSLNSFCTKRSIYINSGAFSIKCLYIYNIFITTFYISIFRVTFLYAYSYMYLISCFLPFAKHTN